MTGSSAGLGPALHGAKRQSKTGATQSELKRKKRRTNRSPAMLISEVFICNTVNFSVWSVSLPIVFNCVNPALHGQRTVDDQAGAIRLASEVILLESRAVAPQARGTLPESWTITPESRTITPESRAIAPEATATLPESRITLPEFPPISPESRTIALESRAVTPEARGTLPESQAAALKDGSTAPRSPATGPESPTTLPESQDTLPKFRAVTPESGEVTAESRCAATRFRAGLLRLKWENRRTSHSPAMPASSLLVCNAVNSSVWSVSSRMEFGRMSPAQRYLGEKFCPGPQRWPRAAGRFSNARRSRGPLAAGAKFYATRRNRSGIDARFGSVSVSTPWRISAAIAA